MLRVTYSFTVALQHNPNRDPTMKSYDAMKCDPPSVAGRGQFLGWLREQEGANRLLKGGLTGLINWHRFFLDIP